MSKTGQNPGFMIENEIKSKNKLGLNRPANFREQITDSKVNILGSQNNWMLQFSSI